jgi:CobB/CobQ-like glutamine amidotransferase domain
VKTLVVGAGIAGLTLGGLLCRQERPPVIVERYGPEAAAGDQDSLQVAVIRLPRSCNFTDVDALALEPGVNVRFVTSPAALADADLVIVPGSKATVASGADPVRSRQDTPAPIRLCRDGPGGGL